MKLRNCLVLVGAATLVLGLSACGDDAAEPDTGGDATPDATESTPDDAETTPDPGDETATDGGDQVVIEEFSFAPDSLEVTTGTTVAWENADGVTHTATAGAPDAVDDTFDIELSAGAAGEHTFDEAGTFAYFCRIHESMRGEIVVAG